MPGLRTVVLCTDVAVHRIWVARGDRPVPGDLAGRRGVGPALPAPGAGRGGAAAGALRVLRRAAAGSRPGRRSGVPPADFCVLVIDSGWGFGPLRGERGRAGRRPACTCWPWPAATARSSGGSGELAARTPRITAVRLHRPGARADGRGRRGRGPAGRQRPAARRGWSGGSCCCSTSCPGTGGTTCCTSWSWAGRDVLRGHRRRGHGQRWRCWTSRAATAQRGRSAVRPTSRHFARPPAAAR